MSETATSLRRKINGLHELYSVVRTMKALAAASIGQYERAAESLADYCRTVELGLAVCFQQMAPALEMERPSTPPRRAPVGILAFGTDQGMVGQFNERIAGRVLLHPATPARPPFVWAVGERVAARLEEHGCPVEKTYPTPNSVTAITPLVGQVLIDLHRRRQAASIEEWLVVLNQPHLKGGYDTVEQRLLPLDAAWRRQLGIPAWPTAMHPEIVGDPETAFRALMGEFLFVSLFKACAESLVAENASRLAAMQRAERNMENVLDDLQLRYNQQRQQAIDTELFDVISGFEALKGTG